MIYCITAPSLGLVKIGFSDNPRGRFSKLQSDSPVALTLERVTEGDVASEKALHRRFAAFAVRGEWFMQTAEIVTWMASLDEPKAKVRVTPVKDLCAAVPISKAYASMILSGRQIPSRSLAIHIFRKTGWRHPLIADLSDEQIATLETIEPWTARADAQAAA
ncbi:GIY-YIG nuclease family protein [Sphingomonas sp.]|uniref:GIY-YIG nuclease family protein n=1 Tax=Sphingomonas sp. TaxID=28214 RepID=UPI0035C7C536